MSEPCLRSGLYDPPNWEEEGDKVHHQTKVSAKWARLSKTIKLQIYDSVNCVTFLRRPSLKNSTADLDWPSNPQSSPILIVFPRWMSRSPTFFPHCEKAKAVTEQLEHKLGTASCSMCSRHRNRSLIGPRDRMKSDYKLFFLLFFHLLLLRFQKGVKSALNLLPPLLSCALDGPFLCPLGLWSSLEITRDNRAGVGQKRGLQSGSRNSMEQSFWSNIEARAEELERAREIGKKPFHLVLCYYTANWPHLDWISSRQGCHGCQREWEETQKKLLFDRVWILDSDLFDSNPVANTFALCWCWKLS